MNILKKTTKFVESANKSVIAYFYPQDRNLLNIPTWNKIISLIEKAVDPNYNIDNSEKNQQNQKMVSYYILEIGFPQNLENQQNQRIGCFWFSTSVKNHPTGGLYRFFQFFQLF